MWYLDVDWIVFIGGLEIVWYVVCNFVENFVVIILELGGKFLVLVFEDVDFDSVVYGLIVGNFGVFG